MITDFYFSNNLIGIVREAGSLVEGEKQDSLGEDRSKQNLLAICSEPTARLKKHVVGQHKHRDAHRILRIVESEGSD